MWLITPRGFYSAVYKTEDYRKGNDMLTVRGRAKLDLDNLSDLIPGGVTPYIEADGWTDYPWRIKVHRDQWTVAVAHMASEVDYSNFKDEVGRVQGHHRAAVYSDVWHSLLKVEDEDPWANVNPSIYNWSKGGGRGYSSYYGGSLLDRMDRDELDDAFRADVFSDDRLDEREPIAALDRGECNLEECPAGGTCVTDCEIRHHCDKATAPEPPKRGKRGSRRRSTDMTI